MLVLIRQGLHNSEIATRLGISINTVRFHVSNLLAKSGFSDRVALLHERWVVQLETTYPELPPGAGLYVVHTPFPLSLLDAYILQPTVDYLYEGESHQVFVIPDQYIDYGRSVMGPDDRMFFYESGK